MHSMWGGDSADDGGGDGRVVHAVQEGEARLAVMSSRLLRCEAQGVRRSPLGRGAGGISLATNE